MSTQAEPPNLDPLQIYLDYNFTADDTYQQGLEALIAEGALDDNPSPDVKEEILRRTRVFYFNRVMGHSISMDEVRAYELQLQSRSGSSSSSDDAMELVTPAAADLEDGEGERTSAADSESGRPHEAGTEKDETRVIKFAELKALIESGREDLIPNNKVIPNALNEAPPSESTAPLRKKPWELAGVMQE